MTKPVQTYTYDLECFIREKSEKSEEENVKIIDLIGCEILNFRRTLGRR